MSKRKGTNAISFFVVWAYLMVLSIVFAPIIAAAIKGWLS